MIASSERNGLTNERLEKRSEERNVESSVTYQHTTGGRWRWQCKSELDGAKRTVAYTNTYMYFTGTSNA